MPSGYKLETEENLLKKMKKDIKAIYIESIKEIAVQYWKVKLIAKIII